MVADVGQQPGTGDVAGARHHHTRRSSSLSVSGRARDAAELSAGASGWTSVAWGAGACQTQAPLHRSLMPDREAWHQVHVRRRPLFHRSREAFFAGWLRQQMIRSTLQQDRIPGTASGYQGHGEEAFPRTLLRMPGRLPPSGSRAAGQIRELRW
jgi:hypothetical protein